MQANLNTNNPIDSQGCNQDLSTGTNYFPNPHPPSPERTQIWALILYIYNNLHVSKL